MKQLTVLTNRETLSTGEPVFVALCPELDIVSQGTTEDEAKANLQEAIEAVYEVGGPDEIQRRLEQGATVSTLEVTIA
ncbi:MAG: type II toxin-antitoxin system HicB family antitoxin [Armatimonadota bacterium]|nr:type II toxin-antitoxin system HicB family antitoxin [Armatimonadota bacterium]